MGLLPELAGLIWITLYYYRRKKEWDWRNEGALVVLVSISVSYYSFPYDEVLVIPALIELAIKGSRSRFLPIYLLLNLIYVIYLTNERFWRYGSPLLICWLSAAWLFTYLFSRTAKLNAAHGTQGF
jgi:hypothetical protein